MISVQNRNFFNILIILMILLLSCLFLYFKKTRPLSTPQTSDTFKKEYFLYNQTGGTRMNLIDRAGTQIKTWQFKPNCPTLPNEVSKRDGTLHHAIISDDNHIYVAFKHVELAKFTMRGERVWSSCLPVHHEIIELPGNKILTLGLREVAEQYQGKGYLYVVDELLTIDSSTGELISSDNLYKPLQKLGLQHHAKKVYQNFLRREGRPHEVMHSNSIAILTRDFEGVGEKGDLLISAKHLNLIFVYDQDKRDISWHWGRDILRGQHTPLPLENGNFLIFNNGYKKHGTYVIELNPQTKEIVWQYPPSKDQRFYCPTMGNAFRLSNGNTIIGNGHYGYAIEVTPGGDIVWQWNNGRTPPQPKDKLRKGNPFYRIIRYTDLHLRDADPERPRPL